MKVPSRKTTSLRGRKLVFPSPSVADKVKYRSPLTKVSSKQEIHVKEDTIGFEIKNKGKSIVVGDPIQIINITTPPEESIHTFKRLKRQLKEERAEVDEMKKG
jgi:hypothetical protein